ncbi:MAG TPA: hypothetical protein VF494_11175 [Candidatus Limnocylindrales bacterium]
MAHSLGGAIAVHVATARAAIVSLLVIAEGNLDAVGEVHLGGQTEAQFVERGFDELLEAQSKEAEAQPDGLRAAHLGITRLVEPRALHREGVSIERGTDPSVRTLLGALTMPRWYLVGALSDPEPDLERDLAGMGVGWKVVPDVGRKRSFLGRPVGLGARDNDPVGQPGPEIESRLLQRPILAHGSADRVELVPRCQQEQETANEHGRNQDAADRARKRLHPSLPRSTDPPAPTSSALARP